MLKAQPTKNEPENLYVRLLIDDGTQYDLTLPPDAPLLDDLIQVLLDRTQNKPGGKIFKIPIEGGQSSLCFSSESLVGIATDPPLEMYEKLAQVKQPIFPAQTAPSKIIPSVFVQIDNFLDPLENQALIDFTIAHQSAGLSPEQGRSLAESFAPWRTQLFNRIGAVLPQVLNQLGIPGFPLPQIEAGLFPEPNNPHKVYCDNGTPETALRVLNFVYYFSEPSGHQNSPVLRIYDSQLIEENCLPAESFQILKPGNNSMIFFLSSYSYEILPVSEFARPGTESCFKFHGWLHRPAF
jgi:Rps23 Pro-64 3,4-dihydroxylase Tpa1-like proline 4-hydroxylase